MTLIQRREDRLAGTHGLSPSGRKALVREASAVKVTMAPARAAPPSLSRYGPTAAARSLLAAVGKPGTVADCIHRVEVELGIQTLGQRTPHAARIAQVFDDPALGVE